MPSAGTKKKKKIKAAKKKKKNKTKNNKGGGGGGISIHSSTNSQGESDNGYGDCSSSFDPGSELNQERRSFVSESKSMEGGSGVGKSESDADTMSRTASLDYGDGTERDSDDGGSSNDEKNQSLKKRDDGGQSSSLEDVIPVESIEKVVSSSDADLSTRDLIEKASGEKVEDISIEKTEDVDASGLASKDKSAIVIEKTKDIDTGESAPKDEGRVISSLDGFTGGNEESKNEEQERVPIAPVTVRRRTSWLGCCGLFDVVTGNHG